MRAPSAVKALRAASGSSVGRADHHSPMGNRMRSLVRHFLFVSVALGAAAPAAVAQNAVVNQLLAATDTRISAMGYTRSDAVSGGTIRGSLRDSGSETTVAHLRAGRQYIIVGVCDEDCSDLDIVLYPATGNTALARDLLTDDAPIVQHQPSSTGDYRIYVSMADCDVEPCGYAVRIYEKSAESQSVRLAGEAGGEGKSAEGRAACSHTTANDVLTVGDQRRGIIGANSCMQADGTPANMYRIDVTERRNVRITMSSGDFDAYLSLYRADGTLIVSDDDGADEGTDSRISMTLAPGTYFLAANVISASSAGTYRLTVE